MIFISYRRVDSLFIVGRLHDHLVQRYGDDQVFMDVADILPGTEFPERLQSAVEKSSIFLVVIGPNWSAADESGKSRLFESDDYVRLEIEIAIERGLKIIPVLIGDTKMPNTDALPSSLHRLLNFHAARLDPGEDFNHHFNRLSEAIARFVSDINDSTADIEQSAQSNFSRRLSRRVFLGAFIGIGSAAFYMLNGVQIVKHAVRRIYPSPLDEGFVKNVKNNKIHHTIACKDHLPKEYVPVQPQSPDLTSEVHKQKVPHIATLVMAPARDPLVGEFVLDALKDNPTATHLYKYLVSLWGKQKDYDRIHKFLAASIEYLEFHKNRIASITEANYSKQVHAHEKAILDLKVRVARANYLASVSEAKKA